MKARVATLTVLALVAIAGSSSSAPPNRPPINDKIDDVKPVPAPPPIASECKGWPCKVSAYSGPLPAEYELAKMQKLGCEPPFHHLGGIREGETSWVGFSCPAHVHKQFKTLPADFSDACLPKRAGRVYVPVYEAKCSAQPFPYDGPLKDQAKKLGCGPLVRYMTGNGNGVLGGIGAYCPDSPALHDPKARHIGFPPGYCDGCLRVPPGQYFVFFETFVGPNCPSGCPRGAGPTEI